MNVFETSEEDMKMANDCCIFTCTYNCEKNIYDTPRIEQTLKSDMLNNCFDHTTSFSAFSVRELQLENLLINQKSDLKSVMTNISKKERENIIEKIKQYELSENVAYFSKEYQRLFDERNDFLWKFLGSVFTETGVTLSTVDDKYKDAAIDIKIVFTIMCAIFDDIADVYNNKELILKLKNLILQPNNSPAKEKNKKIIFVKTLWEYLQNEMQKLPRYNEFVNMLMYDLKQMLNGFDYACLLKEQPFLSNMTETENYDCHNMMVFIFNGVDLMASTNFNKEDLPYMRTAFWHAQKMARIGNWLSTWKREINEKNYGSGVFSYIFSNKIIKIDEIDKLSREEIITRIENSNVYNHFAKDWMNNYEKLNSLKQYIKSIDMDQYIKGLENVIQYHLSTEGLK